MIKYIKTLEEYQETKVSVDTFHDTAVTAILKLNRRNPSNSEISKLKIVHNNYFVWIEFLCGTPIVTTRKALTLFMEAMEKEAIETHKLASRDLAKFRKMIRTIAEANKKNQL